MELTTGEFATLREAVVFLNQLQGFAGTRGSPAT
jgi:hypothetical protein